MSKAKKRAVHKKSPKEIILPRKMSSLIKLALKDIRRAEKTPDKTIIEMSTFFDREEAVCQVGSMEISNTPVCLMCAAGSVMAFTLGAINLKRQRSLAPADFPKNQTQLVAIDSLRVGSVSEAARDLGILLSKDKNFDTQIPPYNRKNPEPFHKAMVKLQTKLEKAGY